MKCIWSVLTLLSACLLMAISQTSRAVTVVIDLTRWTPPDISTVGADPFGELVKYGHELFTNTANEIGPAVADVAKRLAGSNLACQNCHLQAGTQPYAMPLIGFGANSRNIERGRGWLIYSKNVSTAACSEARMVARYRFRAAK